MQLRKTRTDKKDAVVIAPYFFTNGCRNALYIFGPFCGHRQGKVVPWDESILPFAFLRSNADHDKTSLTENKT